MDLEKLFPLRSFFTAYLAGLLWLMSAAFVWLSPDEIKAHLARLDTFAGSFQHVAIPEPAAAFLVALVGLIGPYVVGTALLPVSTVAAEAFAKRYRERKGGRISDCKEIRDIGMKRVKDEFGIPNRFFYRFLESYLLHIRSDILPKKLARFQEDAQLYDALLFALPATIITGSCRLSSAGSYSLVATVVLAAVVFLACLIRGGILREHYNLGLIIGSSIATKVASGT